ncbi:MAG: transcription antitermination factor NusB, partial [Geminicoccaceae bacterium]
MACPANARGVALEVLDRVLGEARPLDETYAGHPALASLDGRDRAFARLLVTVTLRRLGQIDAVLDRFLRRRPKALGVHDLLRLGAAQILFLDTPAHAAVAETVALATGPHAFAKGLLNAVLRRVGREGKEQLAGQDAARLNTPQWLWQSWCRAYGETRARAIAEAHLVEPPLDLSVKADPEAWATRLGAERLCANTIRRKAGGAIEDLPGYAEGAWWVHDAGAAV